MDDGNGEDDDNDEDDGNDEHYDYNEDDGNEEFDDSDEDDGNHGDDDNDGIVVNKVTTLHQIGMLESVVAVERASPK